MFHYLALLADAVGTPVVFFLECGGACVSEIFRQRRARRPPSTLIAALALCALVLWMTLWSSAQATANVSSSMAQTIIPTSAPSPQLGGESSTAPPPPPSATTATQRVAVTIRSQHTGKYWQVLGDDGAAMAPRRHASLVSTTSAGDIGRLRLAASAPPEQRGSESTVFLLEREGEPDEGGWVLLRWLKTRQLVEAVPPGVAGREDDAWSVRLSSASAVHELHKLSIDDDSMHSQSHIWSHGLRGYLNALEGSGEIVGHGDALPPALATEPPLRGAVAVERLQNGAAWLMEALEQRDRQIDAMQQQVAAMRAELAAAVANAPTPGRPVSERERRPSTREGTSEGGDRDAPDGKSGASVAAHGDAAAAGGGALAELRPAAPRKARVQIDCPAPAALAKARNGRRVGGDPDRDDDDDDDDDDGGGGDSGGDGGGSADSRRRAGRHSKVGGGGRSGAARRCEAASVPSWTYMGESEHARFVRGVASRLRLASGDTLLALAAGDCGSSVGTIHSLYRAKLHVLALLPSPAAARQHTARMLDTAGRHGKALVVSPHTPPPVNACVASVHHLDWVPDRAVDGAITFGALSRVRSPKRLCTAFRSVMRTLRPGGRFIIADADHPEHCAHAPRARVAGEADSEVDGGGEGGEGGGCTSCHWRVSAPLAFWSACVPMDMAVGLSTVEHSELPGTASHACAARHYALVAQRASAQHEMALTVEAGADGGKIGVALSLAGGAPDGHWMRRVQHLKEASIDNKRMYCGLHGYSLILGEDAGHGRDAGWDKVKILYNQLANYEWLLWVPLDAIFADSASALGAITDDERAHLVVLQDAGGDGMGNGVLTEPLILRGKSAWSKKLLEDWWGYYAEGFAGSEREALQQLLLAMHEEERARRVRILELDPVLANVASAEPLPWQAAHKPSTLLVTFDAASAGGGRHTPADDGREGETNSAAGSGGSGSSHVCPLRASDRQMLRCLHAFTSHHIKSIQAADAKYSTPMVYDVIDHGVSTAAEVGVTDSARGANGDGGGGGGGGDARGAADAEEVTVRASTGGGDTGGGGSSGGEDLAGGWLTPRLSSGSAHKGGGLTCPAALPGSLSASKRRQGLPSQLPSVAIDYGEGLERAGKERPRGVDELEAKVCASGSSWARMGAAALTKHVLAMGERLGVAEGMSVLDVGATCGHALAILQERHRHKLKAVGVDGSKESIKYARRTCRGSFCVGDVRKLSGVADESFDLAYTLSAPAQLVSQNEVCAIAREMGRVIRPGGRAMLVSVPKADCAVTQDEEWGCPRCFWRLRGIDKSFWPKCLQEALTADTPGGAYRVEFVSNTQLFPFKPAPYCQREHYTVVIHKKPPASVYIYQSPLAASKGAAKLAVLTVASTPPIGEYGKQKVHYLTELSIENKRQHASQRGFDLVVAQNLAHGRTARWDKVMLLRRMLATYEWVHWVDLDTLFMNMKRDPFAFLDPQYDVHVAKDANGLNTGSFYVKASAWSRDFLRKVWEHNDGGKGESDQRSFAHVIGSLPSDERQRHVKYYSQKLFNEYPDPIVAFKNWRGHFREGDYLLHFPGTFCGLSPSGVYTDQHLLDCLHRFTIHFVAAM